jgi:hypothetical protein
LVWIEELEKAKLAATLKVALRILYEWWRNGGRPVKLTNAMLPPSITRKQKSRALIELKELGLVSIERRLRKSPVVTPLKAYRPKA